MIKKYLDIIIILIITLLHPIITFGYPDGYLRKIFAIPYVLFFPGYLLTINLFPRDYELNSVERLIFSSALSISIVPLIGLVINYTPYGITDASILWSMYIFNISMSIIAIIRRRTVANAYYPKILATAQRYFKEIKKGNLSDVIPILLSALIFLSLCYIAYLSFIPHNREHFTEFYVLDEDGKIINYNYEALRYGNNTVIIGIVNHETKVTKYYVKSYAVIVDYNISNGEIDNYYNNGKYYNNSNESIIIKTSYGYVNRISNITPLGEFNTSLPPIQNDGPYSGGWIPQFEKNFSFAMDKPGNWEVWFILYKDEIPPDDSLQNILDAVEGRALYLKIFIRVVDIGFKYDISNSENISSNATHVNY